MSNIIAWVLVGFIVALDFVILWWFQCDCGRSRIWYYDTYHERGGAMLTRAILSAVFTAILVFGLSWFWGPVSALITTYCVRRWWFHEKDKLKKKAAKLAGKVSFNEHGRLVVTSK